MARDGHAAGVVDLCLVAIELRDLAGAYDRLLEGTTLSRQLGDRDGIANGLAGFAQLAASRGESERAVRLASAGRALSSGMATPLWVRAGGREKLEQHLTPIRSALGDSATAALWAEGQALNELEHLAEHYAGPINGRYGQMAAGVLRDVLLILRTGGLVCEHRPPEP